MEDQQQKKSEEKTPISPDEILEIIRERAKEICLERGDKPGDALSDWLQAEKEIKGKYNLL
ncbi:MAG: DUF2934 domain-containing protein [Ignavibacterium sp.]|nr:DUF2934 domain-containing protein [Ignavibacterium sp.]